MVTINIKNIFYGISIGIFIVYVMSDKPKVVKQHFQTINKCINCNK